LTKPSPISGPRNLEPASSVITDRAVLELNRVVSITAELCLKYDDVLDDTIVLACQQSVFLGGFPDHAQVIHAALDIGLLVRRPSSGLAVSDLGEQFLSLNPDRYYELQPAQLPFLFSSIVLEGPLRATATAFAQRLETDRASGTLFIRTNELRSLSTALATCFAIFLRLDVLELRDGVWVVTPNYRRAVATLRINSGVGEERFRQILEDQARFGRAAELLTVEYERCRLHERGAHAQAARVRRISEWDVGAGYDIESFTDSEAFDPDRHIEVKASSSKRLRFFWTRNEYLTARLLGDAYFIYYLGAFDPRAGLTRFEPRIIPNPAATLPALPTIAIEPQILLVTEAPSTRAVSFEAIFDPIAEQALDVQP